MAWKVMEEEDSNGKLVGEGGRGDAHFYPPSPCRRLLFGLARVSSTTPIVMNQHKREMLSSVSTSVPVCIQPEMITTLLLSYTSVFHQVFHQKPFFCCELRPVRK